MPFELPPDVQRAFGDIGSWFAANQGRLLSAALLLAIGLALAMALRALAVRILNAVERAVPERSFRISLGRVGRDRPVSDVVGGVVFWLVLLLFVASAADALGVALLSAVVDRLEQFVPYVFEFVVIVIAGIVVGNLARGAISATAARDGSVLGTGLAQVVRAGIITAAIVIAIAQLGVDVSLLTAIFSVVLAALLGGFALAFGLGARTAIGNIIGSHYMRQAFEVGQAVRISGVEGTIVALTATTVVLEGPDGRTIIPAKLFSEGVSTLLTTTTTSS